MDTDRPRLPFARIKLDWLVQAMHSGWEQQGFFDPATGEVYLGFGGEPPVGPDGEPVDLEDVDWVGVDHVDSRTQYEDMADFAAAVADPVLRDRLQRALQGRGAFRRFRDEMYDAPEVLRTQWSTLSEARCAARAGEWLLDESLVEEAAGEAFVRRQETLAAETLGAVEQHSGPPRIDVADVPGRWDEVRRHVEEGTSVALTRDGLIWAVLEPWTE